MKRASVHAIGRAIGLAVILVLTGASSLPAAADVTPPGPATFDFTDAAGWRDLDWSHIDQSPAGQAAARAGPKDQPQARYPLRRDRRQPISVFGMTMTLELDTAKDPASAARDVMLH